MRDGGNACPAGLGVIFLFAFFAESVMNQTCPMTWGDSGGASYACLSVFSAIELF